MKNLRRLFTGATLTGALLAPPLGGAAPVQASSVTATVPNLYVRTCSSLTRQCTRYRQVNAPHVKGVPNLYVTRPTRAWVW